MRIPFYQTVLTSLVWVVGIAIITGFATRGSSTLAITVGVTTSLGVPKQTPQYGIFERDCTFETEE